MTGSGIGRRALARELSAGESLPRGAAVKVVHGHLRIGGEVQRPFGDCRADGDHEGSDGVVVVSTGGRAELAGVGDDLVVGELVVGDTVVNEEAVAGEEVD